MAVGVVDSALAEALLVVHEGLDALFAAGFDPANHHDAKAIIESLEVVGRRVGAAQVDAMEALDKSQQYLIDGHTSAKVMVRHVGRLSAGEAAARDRCAQAGRDLPGLADAHRAGEVSSCGVRRIARVHANKRVREQLAACEALFVEHAATRTYSWLDRYCTDWVELLDADGAAQRSERKQANRDLRLHQGWDSSWEVRGGAGSLSGARVSDVLDHFVEAEWRTDWENAKAEHGDKVCAADLARTPAQRRWDAFEAMAEAAAASSAAPSGGIVTNVVIDQDTFLARLAAQLGVTLPEPDRSAAMAELRDPHELHNDVVARRCHTVSGHRVSADEATMVGLVQRIRRVVVDSVGVVIDLGRSQRLFTGSARLAVQLGNGECFHPSCQANGPSLQIDHVEEWVRDRGGTSPGNGLRGCGHHNRWKHTNSIRARRRPDGTWYFLHPNGDTIE
jgi:hypothetical protein